MSEGPFSLASKYLREEGAIYLTGVQAVVRVLLDQRRSDARRGLRTAGFISGYPGSPLGGLDLELARIRDVLDQHNIVPANGLNEDIAATSVFGSQIANSIPGARFDGVFGMWFGKSPGVDRTGDVFRHGNFRGVGRNGGVLAIAGDDPHPKSSTVPSDSSVAFYDYNMPVLSPGDVQDVLDLGLHGYALSRASGLWVGLKIVTNIADASGTAFVGSQRIVPVIPEVSYNGRLFEPSLRVKEAGRQLHDAENDLYYARLEMARAYGRENKLNRVMVNGRSPWLGIAVVGKSYFDLCQGLEDLGLDAARLGELGVRLFKVGLVFPLDPLSVREFARGLEEIVVVEDKRAFLEMFIKEALYGTVDAPRVLGKFDEAGRMLLPAGGELSPEMMARAIAGRLRRKGHVETVEARINYLDQRSGQNQVLPMARSSYFCSGCPHNRSLVVPDGAIVGAGIGCHIMTIYMPKPSFGTVVGFTQMGGEGAQWIGVSPFSDTRHFFQNLGDGTFAHSGSLAVRAAVAAGINVTYKLLYNSAVAMTGGQNATGGRSLPEITHLLKAEGVKQIIVTSEDTERYDPRSLSSISSVRHRDELVEAEKALSAIEGVTVLIHDQQCAAEKRRLRKRDRLGTPAMSVFINERVCEGCGDCGQKSNCLSVQPVETEFGRKTQIHQSSCNKDFSCLLGDCPSFATITAVAEAKSVRKPRRPDFALPDVAPRVPTDSFSVLITGIGGTGVVTVNQVLATAAVLDGKAVRALDQLGSSQKAGPVVSHLRIFDRARDLASGIPLGGADLLLIFDLLVGADPVHLAKADPGRTIAVVSTTQVPTGKMVSDPTALYPDMSLLRTRVDQLTRSESSIWLDAQRIAEDLFGDHMASNMVLVGAALQQGALPLSVASIEQAIRLNGVAVDLNLAALEWGRVAVAAPERLRAEIERAEDTLVEPASASAQLRQQVQAIAPPEAVRSLIERRASDLVAYQDEAYAQEYLGALRQVIDAERRLAPGLHRLTEAVAKHLFKLMACKDEYEVARLLLDDTERAKIAKKFGARAKVTWHLHPSFLRRLGVRQKIKLGAWFTPVLRMLRASKWMRRRTWDPFGRDPIRQIERALLRHYRSVVAKICAAQDGYDQAVAFANLPDMVRGYEDVKRASAVRYLEQAEKIIAELGFAIEMDAVLTDLRRAVQPTPSAGQLKAA